MRHRTIKNKLNKGNKSERDRVFGWFSNSHRIMYTEISKQCKSGDVILEIGALYGQSTSFLANHIKHKKVKFYVVDLWDINIKQKYIDMFEKEYGNDMYSVFYKNLDRDNLWNETNPLKVIPMKMTSDDAFQHFLDNDIKFNYIYIDGDHSYEQVLKDIQGAEKVISKNGTIAGDDWNKPGVKKALEEHYAGRFSLFGDKNHQNWKLHTNSGEQSC